MEEKERYEIHIYDDICVDLYDNGVLDKSINDTYKLEDLLNQQAERIEELEEQLKNAILLPKELQVGCKIFWANEDGLYSGKLCAVTKDINPNGDFNIWLYCLYDNGLSYSHLIKDFEVELFATKEEAEEVIKLMKEENK